MHSVNQAYANIKSRAYINSRRATDRKEGGTWGFHCTGERVHRTREATSADHGWQLNVAQEQRRKLKLRLYRY